MSNNPLLTVSALPYELPDFAAIEDEHFLPAFEDGMRAHRAEIDAIIATPEPPTLENTLIPLEESGALLARVSAVFFNLTAADVNETLQDIDAQVSPELTAHWDAIELSPELFARISDVYKSRHDLGLDAESLHLVERAYESFVQAGAELDDAARGRLADLNVEISKLSTLFEKNLLAATARAAIWVEDRAELAGLSDAQIEARADAAAERGRSGAFLITLNLYTMQALLSSLENRALRERLYKASLNRAPENYEVGARIAELRADRAALLGYSNHAHWALVDRTAKTPEAVDRILGQLAGPAMRNARAEFELVAGAARDDGIDDVQPWDWSFYAERVKATKYAVDTGALRPYFALESVLAGGVFHAAEQVYGIRFERRDDLDAYHPDASVWEVFDADGSTLGLYIGDYFARDSKRGGAWMNSFVSQSRLLGTKPVVVNNLNIPKPAAGDPALLTLDEVNTLFHEFGHALHGLFSNVRYPQFSGTSVPRDFVEFPSQVNEMWAFWPEIVTNYARHIDTGEPLPQKILDSIEASSLWGKGFATTEYLAAATLDQAWHRLPPGEKIDDPRQFERSALERAGLYWEQLSSRYRTPYFAHIFANGYSAGYYSYIWSEVFDADTVSWFKENGGLRVENGRHFRETLLSLGGSIDSLQAYRNFRGRDAEIEPLLHRRGLAS